jgi:hypothetical protein
MTGFEILYLINYFILMGLLFMYSINYLQKSLNNNVYYDYTIDNTSGILNNIISNIETDLEKLDEDENNNLMFMLDESSKSKCLALALNSVFPDEIKMGINFTVRDDEDLKIFCRSNNILYVNKVTEYYSNFNSYEYKNALMLMLKYCNKCNIKRCYMNLCDNDIISTILEKTIMNNFNDDVNSFYYYTVDNIKVFNCLFNYKLEDMDDYINENNIYYDNNINFNENIVNDYIVLNDFKNVEWRNKIKELYNDKLNENKELTTKIEDLFDSLMFEKYGCYVELIDDHIPYWMWERLFLHIFNTLEIEDHQKVYQKLYFSLEDNVDLSINCNWRLNFTNNKVVIYNFTELQKLFDNVGESNGDYFNNIKSILSGKVSYKCLNFIDDQLLTYHFIDMNLEDNTNESMFYNFKFISLGQDKICSN